MKPGKFCVDFFLLSNARGSPVQTSNEVEFNTVDVESQLFNISATKSTVAVYMGLRSTLLPIRSTLSSVCTGPKRHGRKA